MVSCLEKVYTYDTVHNEEGRQRVPGDGTRCLREAQDHLVYG